MKKLSLLAASVLLSACSLFSPTGTSESSSSASSMRETRNVSYTGTVETLGPSIYMQGTHQLSTEEGNTVLLESTLLRLEDYVGMEVTIFGSVRPTTEAGGIIMRVDAITILNATSSSESSSSSSEAMTSQSSTAAVATSAMQQTTSAPRSAAVATSAAAVTQSSVATGSTDADVAAAAMAKQDLSPAAWTQQYCSSHIGFCVPIQKNWWYTSFGTTGSALWRVEVSNKEISGLGSGVITISLMTGPANATVQTQGSMVVATKPWKDSTHFEIAAPAALKDAVTHMANSITEYQVAQ